MANKKIENLEELIFENTIEYARENGLSNISTRELAKKCGISEFTIFSHYVTKENLILSIAFAIVKKHSAIILDLFNNKKNVSETYDTIMDYLVNNSGEAYYLYACINSVQYSKNFFETCNTYIKKFSKKVLHLSKIDTDSKHTIIWNSIIIFFLTYSYEFSVGILEYSEENKEFIKNIYLNAYNTLK